jgi:NADPH:quinone reductase-like Zn-dependent oxidoreductase
MKAVQVTSFGTPDVLRVNEIDRPEPAPGEVLVAVEASSVNGHDTLVRAGGLKMVSGRKFPIGLGLDFAGTVAATGSDVQEYKVGDRVWGMVHPRRKHATAGAAEFVAVPAERISRAPVGLSAVEAASLVVAGSTALLALRDSVQLAPGERILVRGAAGGVGTAAVQLGHALGGRVTALARERHARALRELGADEVLDYTATTSAQIGPFDVIFDTVGTELNCYRGRLGKGGRMVTVALSAAALAAIAASSVHGSRRIRTFSANPDSALLSATAEYAATGSLRPVIGTVHPLAEVAAAHESFERGGGMGKHVITVTGGR